MYKINKIISLYLTLFTVFSDDAFSYKVSSEAMSNEESVSHSEYLDICSSESLLDKRTVLCTTESFCKPGDVTFVSLDRVLFSIFGCASNEDTLSAMSSVITSLIFGFTLHLSLLICPFAAISVPMELDCSTVEG